MSAPEATTVAGRGNLEVERLAAGAALRFHAELDGRPLVLEMRLARDEVRAVIDALSAALGDGFTRTFDPGLLRTGEGR